MAAALGQASGKGAGRGTKREETKERVMANTASGGILRSASHHGVHASFIRKMRALGLKWCNGCKRWQRKTSFGPDASRFDGLSVSCRTARQRDRKRLYKRVLRPHRRGPPPLPGRPGDKEQAQHRISVLVKSGRLTHPNELPCDKCGRIWKRGRARHNYHHHLGYAPEHHLDVQALCSSCHNAEHRTKGRTKCKTQK
jgi:hypothetical protein